jgi:hypothetical protein
MLRILLILLLSLLALAAAAVAYGTFHWRKNTNDLQDRLDAARLPVTPRVVDFHELEGLPEPVQRYFRKVLHEGKPMVAGVHIAHRGTFNMDEQSPRWRAFSSHQHVVTRRPGFIWDARIDMMAGLPVRVHDAYVAGEGLLHAALLGLVSVADIRGTGEIAQGELMRFLAEAVWYPTALLPGQGVTWAAVDNHSARATITDGAASVTVLFSFDEEGLIRAIHADARGRTVGDRIVPTPWQGHYWNYQYRDDMVVPFDGEVAWLLPEGAKPYWRGSITGMAYDFAR